jgi:hypothetical protein
MILHSGVNESGYLGRPHCFILFSLLTGLRGQHAVCVSVNPPYQLIECLNQSL